MCLTKLFKRETEEQKKRREIHEKLRAERDWENPNLTAVPPTNANKVRR